MPLHQNIFVRLHKNIVGAILYGCPVTKKFRLRNPIFSKIGFLKHLLIYLF
ncbi:MAG: hypothetical protein KAI83_11880 [Thiomargarita sp.]|nr:hypothetical protein [Thiomargarita sp.]